MQMMKNSLVSSCQNCQSGAQFCQFNVKKRVKFLRLTVYTETDTAKNNFSFKK